MLENFCLSRGLHGSTCVEKCSSLLPGDCSSAAHCHAHAGACVEDCDVLDAAECVAAAHCAAHGPTCAEVAAALLGPERISCYVFKVRIAHTDGSRRIVKDGPKLHQQHTYKKNSYGGGDDRNFFYRKGNVGLRRDRGREHRGRVRRRAELQCARGRLRGELRPSERRGVPGGALLPGALVG